MEIPGRMSETCLRTHAIVAATPEVVATMKYRIAVRKSFTSTSWISVAPKRTVITAEIPMVRNSDFRINIPGFLMNESSPTVMLRPITRIGVRTGVTSIPPITIGALPSKSPVATMKIESIRSV